MLHCRSGSRELFKEAMPCFLSTPSLYKEKILHTHVMFLRFCTLMHVCMCVLVMTDGSTTSHGYCNLSSHTPSLPVSPPNKQPAHCSDSQPPSGLRGGLGVSCKQNRNVQRVLINQACRWSLTPCILLLSEVCPALSSAAAACSACGLQHTKPSKGGLSHPPYLHSTLPTPLYTLPDPTVPYPIPSSPTPSAAHTTHLLCVAKSELRALLSRTLSLITSS